MAHGYYNLKGEFVATATLEAATDEWRKERGYSTGGIYATPSGIVDTTKVQPSAPATPAPAPAPATPTYDVQGIQSTTPATPTYNVQSIQSLGATQQSPYNVQAIQSTPPSIATHLDVPYEQFKANIDVLRQWDAPAPAVVDIEQRQYTLPQFGEQPSGFGIDNTLNQQQLAEAARLTGEAMFVYGQLPDVISIDVARELPFNPTSELFQNVMQEAFGVDGFDTPDEWLTQLGYVEYAPGKWEIQDPVTVTGYGGGYYQGGGISPSSGAGYSAARGGGYSQGGSLVNWRIGF